MNRGFELGQKLREYLDKNHDEIILSSTNKAIFFADEMLGTFGYYNGDLTIYATPGWESDADIVSELPVDISETKTSESVRSGMIKNFTLGDDMKENAEKYIGVMISLFNFNWEGIE